MNERAQVARLAAEFSGVLRGWLSEDELATVRERNAHFDAAENTGACATHDFCDANIAMAEAFRTVEGRAFDLDADPDSAVWCAAWTMARSAGFRLGAGGAE